MGQRDRARKPPPPGAGIELAPDAPIALVVEDDADAAPIAAGLLRLLGYRSRIARDSTEALYALSEGLPSLMVMDVCLPMMDGLGLVKVARRVVGMRTVPVVAVSAVYPEDGAVARGLSALGVTAYLSKPFTLNGLRAAIDEARSAALRLGPAPAPSMGEGLASVTDDDIRDWREDHARATPLEPEPVAEEAVEPAPPSRPAPERPARSDRDTAPLYDRRAPAPVASGRMRTLDAGDHSLDFPVVDTAENELPAEEVVPQALEIYAQATVGRRRLMATVDACSRSSMVLRSEDDPMERGDLVRLELNHRMAVQDSMSDVVIRLLGNVTSVHDSEDGWRYKLRITAARPAQAYDNLIEYFDRFRT